MYDGIPNKCVDVFGNRISIVSQYYIIEYLSNFIYWCVVYNIYPYVVYMFNSMYIIYIYMLINTYEYIYIHAHTVMCKMIGHI